jgi:dienelactone hydrolase
MTALQIRAVSSLGLVIDLEIFGIKGNVHATADMDALEGYVALVRELLRRQEPDLDLDLPLRIFDNAYWFVHRP